MASIGGKTAIDHPLGKNMIGAFHQPRLVVVDPTVARTLSEREFRSGLAEIVKHGIVLDADYFAELERDLAPLAARDLDVLERIIGGSCRLKASSSSVTSARPSFVTCSTTAIRSATRSKPRRGTRATPTAKRSPSGSSPRRASRGGSASPTTRQRPGRSACSETLGLPVRAPSIDVEPIVSAMARDKKAKDGRVPFVLAPRIGAFRIVYDVPTTEVRAVHRLPSRRDVRSRVDNGNLCSV